MRPSKLALSASFLLALPAARADVTIVSEHAEGGETRTATIQATRDFFRADAAGRRGPGFVIGDAAAKKIIVVSPERKAYFELSPDDVARAASMAQSPAVQAMMQEKMKSLPPEQRARIEAMMAQQGTAPGPQQSASPRNFKFEKSGEKKTVNGFACEVYRVTNDARPFEEDCIAPFGATTLTKEDGDAFKRVAEMFKNARGPASQIERWDDYPGFPIVRARLGADGKVLHTTTVKSIKHDALPPDLFKVPAGFTKSAMGPAMMGGGRAE